MAVDPTQFNWISIELTNSERNRLDNNEIISRAISGAEICIVKEETRVFAFSRKCPHAGALLDEGFLNKRCELVCPHHHYKFNLNNGYNSSGEGYYLKVFPVKLEAGKLFIGFKK
jgi:nitrite reductase/ring-hydroxylating ferredoxin subunit